jgi:outer membrane protein assembly factor BamB
MSILPAVLAALLILPLATAWSDDWPRWGGPNRNLTISGNGLFAGSDFGLERVWVTPLGSGYSGILIVGGKVITGFADDESDLLIAIDAGTGRELWRHRIDRVYKGHDGSDDGPLATPAVHDGLVYGIGGFGTLVALELESGKQVWSQQLAGKNYSSQV